MPHPQSKRAKAAKAKRARERAAATTESKASAAERQAVKAEQRDRVERSTRGRQRRRKIRNVGITVLVVLVVGAGLFLAFRPAPELEGVEKPTDLGGGHTSGATYTDSAPTSGAHATNSPPCGVIADLPADIAVHGLEHGAVVLWYDAAQPTLGADLVSATSKWDSHIIISPNTGLDSPVVATAWNRRKAYTEVNDDLIDFVDTYRQRGPESVACDQ